MCASCQKVDFKVACFPRKFRALPGSLISLTVHSAPSVDTTILLGWVRSSGSLLEMYGLISCYGIYVKVTSSREQQTRVPAERRTNVAESMSRLLFQHYPGLLQRH
jgi:hypothetical protein